MNDKIKKRWIEDLLSGEYDQGRRALCSVKDGRVKYCCLGVLAEVLDGEDAWEEVLDKEGNALSYLKLKNTRLATTNLPTELALRAGLKAEQQTELINMNDGGMSFKRIALHIRENY